MAAALRHAARGFGGSVRAVAEEQQRRLLSPTLIHTQLHSKPASARFSSYVKEYNKEFARLLREKEVARLSCYEKQYNKEFARRLREKEVAMLPRYEEYALRLVQQKKEELYDALFDARRYANTWPDTHLLKTLSLHVNHRPDGPHWRRMSRNRKLFNWIGSVWVVSICGFLSTHDLEGEGECN